MDFATACCIIADREHCDWKSQFKEMFYGLKDVAVIQEHQMKGWKEIKQKPYMKYYAYNISQSTSISGFFQNFKYLSDAKSAIRQAFTYTEKYVNHSAKVLADISKRFLTTIDSPLLYIGMHIRLGDMQKTHIVRYGYTMTNQTFYEQAMAFFAEKYGKNRIVFVVGSDSISSAKSMLAPFSDYRIAYLENSSAHEDLSVLSSTHHMITSGGTYGFWAAWSVAGDVVYFSEYARPNSTLDKMGYCRQCFNPPEWIPMGNSR